MHTSPITFRLLLGLLFLYMPQVYGHMKYLGKSSNDLHLHSADNGRSSYSVCDANVQYFTTEQAYYYALKPIYQEAMQVYKAPVLSSIDKEIGQVYLDHLKIRIRNPAWSFLLASGYLRLNKEAPQKVYLPEDVHGVISMFVEVKNDYPTIAKCVLRWALDDQKWDFITEWLEEGIKDPALCREIDYLRDYDIETYVKKFYYTQMDTVLTYGNNFLNERLLQWLINKQAWQVPTDRQIAKCLIQSIDSLHSTRPYKMQCILFFKDGNKFLYHLQCVHILNKSLMTTLHCEDKSEQMRTMRAKVIAHNPYILAPLSGLSIAYWTYMKQLYGEPMAGCNVVQDLLYIVCALAFVIPLLWLLFLGYICCTEAIRTKKADIKSVDNEKKISDIDEL